MFFKIFFFNIILGIIRRSEFYMIECGERCGKMGQWNEVVVKNFVKFLNFARNRAEQS